MSYYYLRETAPGKWALSSQDADTGALATVGTYTTAAEGLAVSGMVYVRSNGNDAHDAQALSGFQPFFFGHPSLAYNPLAPFGWESLPPEPNGASFPQIDEAMMRDVALGDFPDFTLRAKEDPDVDWTDNTGTEITDAGAWTVDLEFTREIVGGVDDAAPRNATKRADLTDSGALPYNPAAKRSAPVTSPSVVSSVTQTRTAPPAHPGDDPTVTHTDIAPAISANIVLGFFRGGTDKTCRLYFVLPVRFGNSGSFLAVYAPIEGDGADFKKIYGLPDLPDDTGGVTHTEIDDDGPTIFGVETKVWGWSVSVDHPSSGDGGEAGREKYTPALTLA